jgi:acyl-coenzyme A thioesterase PaaI-like protein
VVATARVLEEKGKKRVVECIARVDEREVFTGTFTAFVLEHHVFDV